MPTRPVAINQLSDHTYIRELYHHHTLKYDSRYHQERHQSIAGTVHDQKWRSDKHQHTILVKTSLQNQAKSVIADKPRDKVVYQTCSSSRLETKLEIR